MKKKRVKIIELNHADDIYIVRDEDDYLRSIHKGTLLECMGYVWMAGHELINMDSINNIFIPQGKLSDKGDKFNYGPGDVVYDEPRTWRESNVLTFDSDGMATITIDGVPLKGIAQLSVNQDITRARAGIAYVKLEMHVSTKPEL